ncbi:MAG: asparagine synthase (glutamine-hydrolyzing) [Candidatus Harrisonbacteria bacterium]|nr:asparagine synthase (glutamine-hydrolyzing) [Candidatus Harrisonbacteria bacterium]
MCGINGYSFSDNDLIRRMNKATKHRGPDGEGVFVNEDISFGHNLLSITDTPLHSHQPFVSEDKKRVLVYNGEIYNYRNLRSVLEKKYSINFKTDCDTEVLFWGICKEGINFLSRVNGMYAFAFYNAEEKKIILSRDPSGIKPLYYYTSKSHLFFSSEIKGLFASEAERTLDYDGFSLYYFLGYIPGERTLIKNIKKLTPGEVIEYDLIKNTLVKKKVLLLNKKETKEKSAPSEIRNTISEAVERHLIGLRPFGMYLSGGLDSSIIFYELVKSGKKCITYTTRFEAKDYKYNEDANIAQRFSEDLGIEHRELYVTEKDFIRDYEESISTIEEPRYNPSIGAYFALARLAAKESTVIVNGSGGDELFFGYPKYMESRKISDKLSKYGNNLAQILFLSHFIKSGFIKNIPDFFNFLQLNKPLDRWVYLNRINSTPFKNGFHSQSLKTVRDLLMKELPLFSSDDTENNIAILDRIFWLANEEFIRTDKITMHFGMEGRFPLLDKEVVDLAYNIPSRQKLVNGNLKALLKESYKDKLPDYIINKKKTGWTAPVAEWMEKPSFSSFIKEVSTPSFYKEMNPLMQKTIESNYMEKRGSWSTVHLKKIMPLIAFKIWAKNFNITLP